MTVSDKDFIYGLNKILSEELPFTFNVEEEYSKDDQRFYYGILMTLPKDFTNPAGSTIKLPKVYIGKDHEVDGWHEVYIRIGYREYQNFGRPYTPQQVAPKIIDYIEKRFNKEIELMGRMDYVFSSELSDFLKMNGYSVSAKDPHSNSPDLVYHNTLGSYIMDLFIVFSEYKGDVYVEINYDYDFPTDDLFEDPIYRSKLNRQNQKEVFSDILRIMKKLKLNSDDDIRDILMDMEREYLRDHPEYR